MAGNIDEISQEATVTLPPYRGIRKSTVGETYQYFKKLIETKSILNLDECIDSSIELSLFDESLQFLLIDSCQSEVEVLKILLSQNERQIRRVFQCKWFFRNLSADFCTKNIFPYVSLSIRCKIINRLSRHLESTEEAEKYFAFIKDNYDHARAHYILPKCSPVFILAYVEKEKPTFEYNTGFRILQNITKRYPEIGVHILSIMCDKKKQEPHPQTRLDRTKRIIRYLVGHHSDLMVPFLKKYGSYVSCEFGRKLTKKLVTKWGEDIFSGPFKDLIFKEKIAFSLVSFEGKVKFIVNALRCDLVRFSHGKASFFKLVPQDKRLELINMACQEVYELNFNEYPKCWMPELLECLPTETRANYVAKLEEFAEAGPNIFLKNVGYKFFSPYDPEYYVYLYDSRLAFEKFKEILPKTLAVNKRRRILYLLVKSCWINKDIKVLQEVVEYVVTRHRNDDHRVIFRFIEAICDHFPGSTLNSTIFEKLDDLAYFYYLKGRIGGWVYNLWVERHIYHRLENNLDVDNHVKRFFESAFVKSFRRSFVRDFQAKHSKLLILLLSKEAVYWIENKSARDDAEEDRMIRCILNTCREYNRVNRKQEIFLGEIPGMEGILRKRTEATYGEVGGKEWSLDIWQTYYDDTTSAYHKPRSLFCIFKRRPELIEKHLEGILKIMFEEFFMEYNAFVIFLMKTVSFFGKTEKMKEIILNEFKNGKLLEERKTALMLYSYICTIDEFSRVTESYLPKQEKLDRGSDEAFNEIQMLVPRLIKNIKPRHKNLELVLKFFLGDFLKTVLPSFYSCCFYTRCDVIILFLKKLLEEVPPKVSYVKNIIRLILLLSDKNGRTEFFVQCWDMHKHYSVRSVVLRFLSQFVFEERSQESFRVLEKCILDCDEMTIEALPEIGKIPEKLLNNYVNTLWRFSDMQKPNFRVNFRKNLLQRFNENNTNFLSKEFCESIIKTYMFDESLKNAVDGFAAVYVASKPEDMESRVFMVLNLIKERKPNTHSIYGFFNILIENSRIKPSEFADLFTLILKNWPEYPDLYEQRVLFTYHNMYQKVIKRCGDGDNAFAEFGRELRKFCATVENLRDLLPIYANGLNSFLENHEAPKVILTLKELVAGSQERAIAILAILCVPIQAVVWYKNEGLMVEEYDVIMKRDFDEFVKILEGYADNIVQIYLRSKFDFDVK